MNSEETDSIQCVNSQFSTKDIYAITLSQKRIFTVQFSEFILRTFTYVDCRSNKDHFSVNIVKYIASTVLKVRPESQSYYH